MRPSRDASVPRCVGPFAAAECAAAWIAADARGAANDNAHP